MRLFEQAAASVAVQRIVASVFEDVAHRAGVDLTGMVKERLGTEKEMIVRLAHFHETDLIRQDIASTLRLSSPSFSIPCTSSSRISYLYMTASNSVDLPIPFSPTRKVTGFVNTSLSIKRRLLHGTDISDLPPVPILLRVD